MAWLQSALKKKKAEKLLPPRSEEEAMAWLQEKLAYRLAQEEKL